MTDDRFAQIEDVFHEARMLDVADRASFLDRTCGNDLTLRSEVESLLLHADGGTEQIDMGTSRAGETIVDRGPLSEGPGTRIGHYRILQQIGEGGFGVVYMAEQELPVRRKVALKIIKLGMDTKQVIARFEAERQALALMDHPNIAKVLDAGATGTGRPYFVMELVRGIPITEFCDDRRLSTADRLRLFIQVCHALQHAHHKGIIHRDVKPSNVMVTLHDDTPVPKVIDFGIAKATSHRLTERTLFTEFRQFVGTPEYMSPDQAEISGLDIDTRTDIYSLGVLLYELITGSTPLDSSTLRMGGYAEIQRIIREVEPPMPSTRLVSLNGPTTRPPTGPDTSETEPPSSIEEIARRRGSEPTALRRLVRGDLDWIVMKAMEKDRVRRYQTANELAADIERHLSDEPVLAGPPNIVYKLGKFMRRHRVTVMATSLVAATLVVGLSLAMIGFVRANREAAHSRAVSEFLQSLMIELDPGAETADALSVDEIVDRGRALFGADHAVVGTLLMTRASSLSTAGRLEEAVEAQREALSFYRQSHDGDHPSIAAALGALADLLERRNDIAAAEAAHRETLDMKRRLYGDSSRMTADAMEGLASLLVDAADTSWHDEIRELWPKMVAAYESSLGAAHHTTATERCKLGTWLHNNGYHDEAGAVLPLAVQQARTALDPDDFNFFITLNAWGQHLILQEQDLVEGTSVVIEMAGMSERVWGPSHHMTLSLKAQLVPMYKMIGEDDAAERSLLEFLELRRDADFRSNLTFFASEQQALVSMKSWLNDHPDVGREFRLAFVEDARPVLGERSPELTNMLEAIADWLVEYAFYDDAETLQAEVIANLRAGEPEGDDLTQALAALSLTLMHLDRPSEAEVLLEEAIGQLRAAHPDSDWRIASGLSMLGECLVAQQRFEEAERVLLDADERMKRSLVVPAGRRERHEERLVALYEAWGRPEEAARRRDG